VLEDALVALNPNQANYIPPCMESIKGVSRKGKKKNKTFFWTHYHSQLDTPHAVELLWTSDQLDAETST
jgi:hypothetical protein